MASLIAIFAVTLWLVNKRNQRVINWEKSSLHILAAFFWFVVFLWVNAVLLRALAIYLDLNPFHLFSVQVVQMSLSILWATIALILVIVANRIHSRAVWIAGAVLMGLLILKLVAVDFIESDTVERIVAFLGAGVLLLIAGYVAPIPVATVSGDKHVK